MQILRRYSSASGIEWIGRLWTLHNGLRRFYCDLFTHPLGWQLRRELDGSLLIMEVCKTETDVFLVCDDWKRTAIDGGWIDEDARVPGLPGR